MQLVIDPHPAFRLALANQYFGGWLSVDPAATVIALAFPVEGWQTAAAVLLRQEPDGTMVGEVQTDPPAAAAAWRQTLAVLSLDVDSSGWAEVGTRDPVLGRLQQRYDLLRPVLFHSPYEAAAAFIIGHRISIEQGRAIRQRMAQELGTAVQVGDHSLHAFPGPQIVRDLTGFHGVSTEKIRRLNGVAQAALDGLLDRTSLRAMPHAQALAQLRKLPGIGPFFAQGILFRGAGVVDAVPDDEVTKQALQRAYQLPQLPTHETVLRVAEAWRPYRMWATVLLHVWLRREAGGPQRPPRRAKTLPENANPTSERMR